MIADPLSIFFAAESFNDLKAPVQLWGSERGGDGVTPEGVRDIVAWLPTRPDFRVVPNSHHFDFLGPCPAELAKSRPEICDDEPGFDRLAFHKEFNAAVPAFFREHLRDAQRP